MYYSDKVTDEKLKKLEKRIARMYQGAYAEMAETWDKYINGYDEDGAIKNVHHKSLKERYDKEYQAFLDGAYTEAEFKAWYRTQIERGEGYAKMRDQLAKRMTNANMVASAYINDATPSVYTLNRDYEAYRINNAYGVDFHLGDEMTERRLIGQDNHIEFKTTSVNPTRDYNWNREQIHKALTAGIMQGKSIDKLTDAYMQVMKRNRSSAIRNARTSFTSAQNAGRIETYYRATEMGISLTKEWIANHDAHTRDSHAHLDGERVAYDMPFSNGLRYPADPEGIPAEVYNCRCTMRAVLPKINDGKLGQKYQNEIEEKEKTIERFDLGSLSKTMGIIDGELTPAMINIIAENDIDKQMYQINELVSPYFDRTTNWNGKTKINNKLYGAYGGYDIITNEIELKENTPLKSKIHEIIHGYCIYDEEYASPKTIKIEEGAVELLAEEICKENGVIAKNRTYKKAVKELKYIAKVNNMSYIEVSKAIINTPSSKMLDRYNQLKKK